MAGPATGAHRANPTPIDPATGAHITGRGKVFPKKVSAERGLAALYR
jgi:hypothetical protein